MTMMTYKILFNHTNYNGLPRGYNSASACNAKIHVTILKARAFSVIVSFNISVRVIDLHIIIA